MVIIFGLGNNDKQYLQTKHNAGRVVLENIMKNINLSFNEKPSYSYARAKVGDEDVYFLYSSGFMNDSGQALEVFCKYFKLIFTDKKSKLFILHDDSDQLEGNQKLVVGGGSAGHNGVKSIYKHIFNLDLSIEKIWRLKIGIRPIDNKLKSETFVLSRLGEKELLSYKKLADRLTDLLPLLLLEDLSKLQNILNGS